MQCANIGDWKKRNGCGSERKVFICANGYPDFRDALLRRGWHQNTVNTSSCFDLKWAFASGIDHENLQPEQVANHYQKTRELTTKSGLTTRLKDSVWLSGVPADHYYPRAYDLYDSVERAEFVLDFKLTKAESILRRFLQHLDEGAATTFSMDVVGLANKICMRMVTDVDEVVDCEEIAENLGVVPSTEWAVLKKVNLDDVEEALEGGLKKKELDDIINKQKKPLVARSTKDDKDKDKKKKKKKEEEETPLCGPAAAFETPRGKFFIETARGLLRDLEAKNPQHTLNGGRNAWIIKPSGKSRGRGIRVMRELDEIFSATESDGFQWICQKYMERPELVHGYKFDIRQWVLVTSWNPLTVYVWRQPYLRFAGKKYDNTCTDRSEYVHLVNNSIIKNMDGFKQVNEELQTSGYMWFRQQWEELLHTTYCKCGCHNTSFLRPPPYTCETFGVKFEDVKFIAKEEDDSDCEGDDDVPDPPVGGCSSDTTAAPTASSVSLASASTSAGESSEVGSLADTMPSSNDGADNMQDNTPASVQQEEAAPDCPVCPDMWETRIKPQMDDIILKSLLCVCEQIEHRENTFEMYGYDFMFSETADGPQAWLIEVNSSPACDYSTPVTCPLVKKVMEDIAKVVVDGKEKPDAPTGEWELLTSEERCCRPWPTKTCHTLGGFQIAGTRIKPPKGFGKKKKKKKKSKRKDEEGSPGGGEDGEEGDEDAAEDGEADADDGDADEGDSD
eukprot:TRINITY_DN522_c0_g1_i1.p1 TRINITY_DN522_c0_g1~~TRINITY_DN522_c0_g1_i1.p1  ORF type:complete len:732 (+),score=224.11 TRINITY_DN522_c0_g1_i1:1112-3307(+)